MHPILFLFENRTIQRKVMITMHWLKALTYFGVAGIVLVALICAIGMIVGFLIDRK